MNIELLKKLGYNWHTVVGCKITGGDCPPEAKVRTGDQRLDAMYHRFEKESGLIVHTEGSNHVITGYDVVDSEKFIWFTLRYS